MLVHYLAVFAPLIGFLAAGLFGKRFGDYFSQVVTSASVILAAILSVELFFTVVMGQNPTVLPVMDWISSGDFQVSWALRVDQLSVVMMCVINIVSACVHVYSIGYMAHDESKSRFMAYLSLFTFAMLMLVSADNLLQLFFGWEGVGLASYLLIGFWYHKPSANAAAVKAFLVNRVGDIGLILGILAIFVIFGSVRFDDIFAHVAEKADMTLSYAGFEVHALTFACLLLFIGAVGKSAQLGLHTWLPDAMEGPTPVSALIHAATMVTAGVFLLARFSPVYEYAPDALAVVCVVGALTAFVAATIGMTQFDIKRVIAYSTMSQLGYMFFALGVSAYSAAMFHLVTHAFFKALLFLGAGSVIHAMSDEQDMRKMGGVWKMIPLTYIMMWIGSLALAGVPFFAGYYSKDLILESVWASGHWYGHFAFWVGIAAAVMTAFYSWRLIIMTFHGKPRADHHVMDHVHESPAVMMFPLVVLAIGALFSGAIFYGGFAGVPHETASQHVGVSKEIEEEIEVATEDQLETPVHEEAVADMGAMPLDDKSIFFGKSIFVKAENDAVAAAHSVEDWVKRLPIAAGLVGIFLAWFAYVRVPSLPATMIWTFKPLHTLFFRKWFFDEIYDRLFVRSAFSTGKNLWEVGDQKIIDGVGANGIASTSRRIGAVLSKVQNGFVYQYAFFMIFGLIALVSWIAYATGIIRFE
ncbi:MAG TPA: NADH-quinone oxidoreductase subunit L [Alphaproteobacteria bacterium]|nr:NADH-quinone oxidoreductase subunit L [Alphaproteobacteria bacterium]HNS44483.1 NADH-quinone oxidoreductase subunit L [Alphaproteobacteria bacterium]